MPTNHSVNHHLSLPYTELGIQKIKDVYTSSAYLNLLAKQRAAGEKATAIFTDVDNTFYHEGAIRASKRLVKEAHAKHYPLIAVTGSDFEGVYHRIQKGELPHFAVIAGSVGTEIYILYENGKKFYRKDQYYDYLVKAMQFDRRAIVKKSFEMIAHLHRYHPTWQFQFQLPEVEKHYLKHPKKFYQPYKVSFHFFASLNDLQEVEQEVQEYLSQYNVVICEEVGYNKRLHAKAKIRKYCLDVLAVTKADAVKYLELIGNITRGIVAGDSGNDISMLLTESSLSPVIVGGYRHEVRMMLADLLGTDPSNIENTVHELVLLNGKVRRIYIEQRKGKLAAESILHALSLLLKTEPLEIKNKKKFFLP